MRFLFYVLLVGVAIFLLSCSNGKTDFRIGVATDSMDHLPIDMAMNLNYLDDTFKIKRYASHTKVLSALKKGKIEVGILPYQTLLSISTNEERILRKSFLLREGIGILTKKNYQDVSQLSRKKVGSLISGGNKIMNNYLLRKIDLQVNIVEYSNFDTMLNSLESGEIEAIVQSVPQIMEYASKYKNLYWFSKEIPNYPNGDIYINSEFTEDDNEKMQHFLRAINKSVTILSKNPAIAFDAVQEFYDYNSTFSRKIIYRVGYSTTADSRSEEFIKNMKRMINSTGSKNRKD